MKTDTAPHSPWPIDDVVAGLRAQRERWREARSRSLDSGGREFPVREQMQAIMDALCGALFPMRLGPADLRAESEDYYVGHTLDRVLNALAEQVRRLEKKVERERIVLAALPELSLQIVEFAREYGRVTMMDAIKLTGASRNTLKQHFRDLTERNYLDQHGSGRGVWYGLK